MGRPKGSKNKPKPANGEAEIDSVIVGTPTATVAEVVGDPLDKKLDHFQYATDEHSGDIWEHGEGINPLDLPKAVRERYPHLRFHWCSESKWDKKGKDRKSVV